jgi:hypothetical protein
MTMSVQEAAATLIPDVRRDVNWFAEPGQKQFIDPISLGVIAMGLVKLFVTAAVTAAGTETAKLAVAYVRNLIAGREKVEPKELDGETATARAQLAKLSPEEAIAKLAQAQAVLCEQFAEVMPRARAMSLAERVHSASVPLLQPNMP